MRIPKSVLCCLFFLSTLCCGHNIHVTTLSASFTFSPESPAVGQSVKFTDTSSGDPAQWAWAFGDGTMDSTQSPNHAFSTPGSYSVSLTVTAGSASDKASRTLEVASTHVITAASPALEDVQDAINAAGSGDTVRIPSGTATWPSQLIITKGVMLVGAGSDSGGTLIISSYRGYAEYSDTDYLIVYKPSNPALDEPFRLSGLSIDCAEICGGIKLVNEGLTPITKIRVDHNKICRARRLYHHVEGTIYGVADNNTVDGSWHTDPDMVDHRGLNETTWQNQTYEFGTANNWYWEDNTFICRNGDVFDAYEGGRYVARFNTIKNVNTSASEPGTYPCFNFHGNQSCCGQLSAIGCEIYGNTINGGYINGGFLMTPRGGKVLCYDNAIIGNTNWAGVLVREESSDYDNPPVVSPISGQPQHVSDSYFWGNTLNGTIIFTYSIDDWLNYGSKSPFRVVPQWDLDCWKETAVFNGTTGMGTGPISARPVSCSLPGSAWWASDEKKLYRWKNGSWETYYVPYTYPHPLRFLLNLPHGDD